MTDFETLEIADKRTLREKINRMMAAFLARGGVITKCGKPDADRLIKRNHRTWSMGEKVPPTKPKGVA